MNAALALTAVLAAAPGVAGQVAYTVAFPNAIHHEAHVTMTLYDLPLGLVELRMSRSSPGRYALHEFAKNVYDVRITDTVGRALPVHRPNPYQWDVGEHDGAIRVAYTVYADRGDGTYAQVDRTHAHLNMPAVFMWARGLGHRSITVTFHPPPGSGWRVATQLVPTDDPHTFTARNLQYFMDSPTELSRFTLREWTIAGAGRADTIRLAVHHLGTEADVDAFAARVRKVVDAEVALFGGTPPFDHGTYTFIADYLPWMNGDGMEHRNSTIVTSSAALADAPRLIGTIAHEFFHAWNVERLRPAGLEPFDFERANMSGALWFAEGFTSYYAPVFLRRAGLTSLPEYAHGLADAINTLRTSPGSRFFSPVGMSMQAPFVDAATSLDPTNEENTFISYYTWGSALGLALDLELRGLASERTLDGFFRLLWDRLGRPERPYTLDDLERELGVYAGQSFAQDFFARYVRGRDIPPFDTLLARAGLLLRPRQPGAAFLGLVDLSYSEEGAHVVSNTRLGSPLYEPGIARGDLITRIGDVTLRRDEDWGRLKAALTPGDTVGVTFISRDGRHTASLVVAEDPRIEVVTFEEVGRTPTPAMRALREDWLGSAR